MSALLAKLPSSDKLNRGVLFATSFSLVILAAVNVVGFFNDSFTCGSIDTDEEKRAKATDTINRQLNVAYGLYGVILAFYAIQYTKNNNMQGTYVHMLAGVAILILASWFSVFGQNMDFEGKVVGGNKQTKCRHPIEGFPIAFAIISLLLIAPAGLAMFKKYKGM